MTASSVMSVNSVYFPAAKIYDGYTPAKVNYACVNIVYYAFASINPSDGLVFVSGFAAPRRDGNFGSFGLPMYEA
jgi:chitinase